MRQADRFTYADRVEAGQGQPRNGIVRYPVSKGRRSC